MIIVIIIRSSSSSNHNNHHLLDQIKPNRRLALPPHPLPGGGHRHRTAQPQGHPGLEMYDDDDDGGGDGDDADGNDAADGNADE